MQYQTQKKWKQDKSNVIVWDGRQGLRKKGSLGNNNKACEIFVQSDYLTLVGMGAKMHASIRRSTVHTATAVFDWFQKQCHIKHINFQFILSNELSKNLNTSQYAKRNYQKCDNGTQHHNVTQYAQESKCFWDMYVGVLISPQPDLLPDVVGRNR